MTCWRKERNDRIRGKKERRKKEKEAGKDGRKKDNE